MDHRFLQACRGEPVDRTPIWLMRQAGRILPEYRRLREQHSLETMVRTPELAAEVSLQPVRRFEVDAAILFSDVVLPLAPMGIPFQGLRGDPPTFDRLVASGADIDRLRVYEPREELSDVLATIRIVRQELDDHRPLLGYAGAPFTLACYAIEGGRGNVSAIKSLMYGEPDAWHRLCEKIATVVAAFLRAQVEAGVQAVQLFDSWAGALSPEDYRRYVLPHTRAVFDALEDLDVPTIHFGLGSAELIEALSEAGGMVIGVDWRTPLDEAWERLGPGQGVQGNLDPTLLVGPTDRLMAGAADVLERAGGRAGHIFNLGHGLLPSTPIDRVQALIRYVHRYSAR